MKTPEQKAAEYCKKTNGICAECLENFEMDENFKYCPNCGRKIIRK